MKMINTIMMMKDGEDSFATVDLVVVDRRSGRTKFYKIGAAPTLIRRRNNIEEVRLSAVPLGIVNGLEIRSEEIFLKKGDFLIMMSDGVSDGPDGRGFLPQLAEILRSIRSEEPAVICDLVLDQVSDSYLGKEPGRFDDNDGKTAVIYRDSWYNEDSDDRRTNPYDISESAGDHRVS